ncbi:DUF1080 domain-containing protein [Allomuricauda sp. SCSIO 65647]|uniref:3-keto-disaccharide hydrolase n=1 Tax=Allomuricauda sp. SCSIO 65647 TaxID=2908843 RepID=UPI001F23B950|nr:DUF1080 domain-containing protein [Muricauda sp. SCSIO 65647]UJH66935.1 DUF1080 domain-containing protein [Muricauda sp. SCSIO 65647]
MKPFFTFLLFLAFSFICTAQNNIDLTVLDDFQGPFLNWQIIGDISVDPNINALQYAKAQAQPLSKKEQRRRRKKGVIDVGPIKTRPGTGILYNDYKPGQEKHLLTKWEHGDIKLEMEVMVPKGSNSGIYLQGRYEIQIMDSWGTRQPKYGDIGGLYRNWEKEPEKVFMGVAPLANAAKAPGLWQKLNIHFQAPKFDASGKKIKNARLVSVYLNDVLIHNNVEIPRPTGGPISKEETPAGPLMIQGDHGPVAFRNIKYILLSDLDVSLNELSFTSYKGEFKDLEDISSAEPAQTGQTQNIDVNLTGEEDQYGLVFKGELNVPKDAKYIFTIGFTGGFDLLVNNKSVVRANSSYDRGQQVGDIFLKKGTHQLELKNIKAAGWLPPRLGFSIRTTDSNPKKLHALDSYPPSVGYVSPIYVDVGNRPRLLRGFVSFNGNDKKLSHTLGVGIPGGINYVYDLKAGNLIGAWRGDFVDATPMWHNRGNGSFQPRGDVQWTFLGHPLGELDNLQQEFPMDGTGDYQPLGYVIDPSTGLPSFRYSYKNVEVENKIIPTDDDSSLINEISFSEGNEQNWYYKIATGKVEQLKEKVYVLNDHQYYLSIESGHTPITRKINDQTELLLPVNGNTIKYKITW